MACTTTVVLSFASAAVTRVVQGRDDFFSYARAFGSRFDSGAQALRPRRFVQHAHRVLLKGWWTDSARPDMY